MPATLNTVNKWTQGIGDTLVTSLLCEAGTLLIGDLCRPLSQDGSRTPSSFLQEYCLAARERRSYPARTRALSISAHGSLERDTRNTSCDHLEQRIEKNNCELE